MATRKPDTPAGDDHGGAYARGDIDLSELNRRASEAGAAVTTAEYRNAEQPVVDNPAAAE